MATIKSEAAYRAALERIEELLPLVNDSTPTDDKNYLELDMISDMVEEYEGIHYPIGKPSLIVFNTQNIHKICEYQNNQLSLQTKLKDNDC